MTPIVNRF